MSNEDLDSLIDDIIDINSSTRHQSINKLMYHVNREKAYQILDKLVLEDPDDKIRQNIISQMLTMKSSVFIQSLSEVIRKDAVKDNRIMAMGALSQIGSKESTNALITILLEDNDPDTIIFIPGHFLRNEQYLLFH